MTLQIHREDQQRESGNAHYGCQPSRGGVCRTLTALKLLGGDPGSSGSFEALAAPTSSNPLANFTLPICDLGFDIPFCAFF